MRDTEQASGKLRTAVDHVVCDISDGEAKKTDLAPWKIQQGSACDIGDVACHIRTLSVIPEFPVTAETKQGSHDEN